MLTTNIIKFIATSLFARIMKFSNMCIFFFYYFEYWTIDVSEAKLSTVAIQDRINAITNLRSNKLWQSPYESLKIIVDGKVVTINEYVKLKQFSTTDETVQNHDDMNKFLFDDSKVIYTAFKCEYSDLIITTFYFFFNCLTSCNNLTIPSDQNGDPNLLAELPEKGQICVNDIIAHVVHLKKYIIRMIFNLMYFVNISSNLESTDHTLLKSLISIHLFISYVEDLYTDSDEKIKQNMNDEKVGGEDEKIKIQYYTEENKHEIKISDESEEREKDKIYGQQNVNENKSDSANKINSEIDLKIIISQILYLVNNFNCKHCFKQNLYNFDDYLKEEINKIALIGESFYEGVDKLLENIKLRFETMNSNVHIEELNELKIPLYNVNMYDLNNILLEEIFHIKDYSFFQTLQVRWKNTGHWNELQTIYNEVKKSYDIRLIFDYQILLIEVVKDLFYKKIMNIYIDKHEVSEMGQLIEAFDRFIDDVIPYNYPTNLYSPIIEMKNALYDLLKMEQLNDDVFTNNLIPLLTKSSVIKTWGKSNDINTKIAEITMSKLIQNILELKLFDNFIRFFELFLYESNTIGDYHLHRQRNDGEQIGNSENIDLSQCQHLERLRNTMIAFQLLMDGCQKVDIEHAMVITYIDSSIGSAILAIRKIIVLFYKTYFYNDKLNTILLPLMIDLPDDVEKVKTEKCLQLRQTMTLALHKLEYYQLNNCKSLKYNHEMYRQITGDEILYQPFDGKSYFLATFFKYKNNLATYVSDRKNEYKINQKQEIIYSITIEQLIPKTNYSSSANTLDSDGYPLWNGSCKPVDQIYIDMTQTTVDYQYLARFQFSRLKWIVSNVIKKLYFIFSNYDSQILSDGNGNEDIIKDLELLELNVIRFRNLPFPKSLSTFLWNTVDLYSEALTKHNKEVIVRCLKQMIDLLNKLTISTENPSTYLSKKITYSISELCSSFRDDIQNLKTILMLTDDNNLIDKLPFSSILY